MNGASNVLCILAADLVRCHGRMRLRVRGTSMVPAFRPGDTIYVERAAVAAIQPGEIAIFARDGRLVAHRVTRVEVGADGWRLVTRGDRTLRADAPVLGSELLGRATSIERGRRCFRPRAGLNTVERTVCWVLSHSERATGLYLRLTASDASPR